MRISTLLTTCADAQRVYFAALTSYRAALKDVLTREGDVRTVMRDREILVSRLIKLSNKKATGSADALDVHAQKLDDAKRELAACEAALKSEQWALGGVKRRIFRDALGMRMRSLADLATVLDQSAHSATDLLDGLGADPAERGTYADFRSGALASPNGSRTPSLMHESIAPSMSASQNVRPSPPGQYPASIVSSDGGRADAEPDVDYAAARRSLVVQQPPPSPSRSGPTRSDRGDASSDEDATGRKLVVNKGGGAKRQSLFGGKGRPPAPRSEASELSERPSMSSARPKANGVAFSSRASSDGSQGTARPETPHRRERTNSSSGLWSAFTSLFRDRPQNRRDEWSTRTDRHLAARARTSREDSSEDEMPRQRLVRVVNKRPGGMSRNEAEIRRQAEIAVAGGGLPPPGAQPPIGSLGRSGTVKSAMSVRSDVTSATEGTAVAKRKKRVTTRPPVAKSGIGHGRAPSILSVISDPANDVVPPSPGGQVPSRTYATLGVNVGAVPKAKKKAKAPSIAGSSVVTASASAPNGLLPPTHMVLPSASMPSLPTADGQLLSSHMVLPSAPPRLSLAEIRATSSVSVPSPAPSTPAPTPAVASTPARGRLAPPSAVKPPARSTSPLPSAMARSGSAQSPAGSDVLGRRKSVRMADDVRGSDEPAHIPATPAVSKTAEPAPAPTASTWATRAADDSSGDEAGEEDQIAYVKVRYVSVLAVLTSTGPQGPGGSAESDRRCGQGRLRLRYAAPRASLYATIQMCI